jgi:hypothetical protein
MGGADAWQNAAFSQRIRNNVGNYTARLVIERASSGEIPHFVDVSSANRR